uniref:Ground-like domain-containing protein n=1 Tax=Angiostrongylus cantonensis TaxID=6313 RepID=A0A0K0D8W3_ANGCA
IFFYLSFTKICCSTAPSAACSPTSNDVTHSLFNNLCLSLITKSSIFNDLFAQFKLAESVQAVQQRIQMRYNASFEVIVSESDFVVITYYSGPRRCKFETDRYFVALYQTPVQVKVSDTKSHNRRGGVELNFFKLLVLFVRLCLLTFFLFSTIYLMLQTNSLWPVSIETIP